MAVNAEDIRPIYICAVCKRDIYPCSDRYKYVGMFFCDDPECLAKAAKLEEARTTCFICGNDLAEEQHYTINGKPFCKRVDCIAKAIGARRID
ncbi:hypothetical protein V6C27_02760 [Peptococcaceae bacterium 1198_IL3148]